MGIRHSELCPAIRDPLMDIDVRSRSLHALNILGSVEIKISELGMIAVLLRNAVVGVPVVRQARLALRRSGGIEPPAIVVRCWGSGFALGRSSVSTT